jgi:hypothetical protein
MTVRPRSTLIATLALLAAFTLAGCGAESAGVDAAAEILPVAEPLADLRLADQGTSVADGAVSGVATAISGENDTFSAFGLLAPALSGAGLETYSTSCDPFEDPYGACL